MFDQTLDVVGYHLLGADQHVDRDGVVVEQAGAGQVGRFAHPGDARRGVEQGVGDLAGDHVHFVAVGHRHQHVGIVGAGLAQHGRIRGLAGDGADVQAVAEVAQALAVGVDHGDVVGFAGEVLGQCAADLAGTEDDDFHGGAGFPIQAGADNYRAANSACRNLDQFRVIETVVPAVLRQQLAAVRLPDAPGTGQVQFARARCAG
ncbi:hypothetical protein D9M73_188400 [compost metagenome]